MKIRNGFVSNSSSSSFYCFYKNMSKSEAIDIVAQRQSEVLPKKFKESDIKKAVNQCIEEHFENIDDYYLRNAKDFKEHLDFLLEELNKLDDGKSNYITRVYGCHNGFSEVPKEDCLEVEARVTNLVKDALDLYRLFPKEATIFFEHLDFWSPDFWMSKNMFKLIKDENWSYINFNFADGGESFNTISKYHNIEEELRYKAITFDQENIMLKGESF